MDCFRECTRGFAKYILILFNFLILIAACLLIALSVKSRIENAGAEGMLMSSVTVVVGVIVALIAFFGCCGACTGNTCMIITYSVICILIAIVQLILGIFIFISIKNSSHQLQDLVMSNLDQLYGDHSSGYYEEIDHFQRMLECCGRTDDDLRVKNGTGLINSCCPPEITICTSAVAFKDTCTDKVIESMISIGRGIGITCLAFSATEVAGATLIGVGVLLKLKNNDIENFIPDKYHLGLPPILMIAIGSVVFLTAFFGCCGAIKESTCMLTTFAIILLTLLIIQVAIGAYAFLIIGDTQDLRQSVRQVVEKSYNQYNETRAIKEEFDFLQTFLKCCGIDGPRDWKWSNDTVPDTCCASQKNCVVKSSDCYRKGCADGAYAWFKNGLDLLGILAVAVASIEIVGAIFALCLSSSIKNQLRREAYA